MPFFLHPLVAAAAVAAYDPPSPPPAAHREKILVTAVASRAPERVDDTPATVTVIERVEIERALARDVRDALRHEPAVSVANGAARFGLGDIAIRGLDGARVLVTLDGIRMPEGYRVGSFSNASRHLFDTGLLQRIEVLHGPGSALHGSDALAGVLAVTTVDTADFLREGKTQGGSVEAGYGQADGSVHRSALAAGRLGTVELLAGMHRVDARERESLGTVDGTGAARTVANPQDASATARLAKAVLARADGGFYRATYEDFDRRVATDVLSLNPQSPRTVSLAGDDRARRERASVDAVLYGVGFVDRLALLAYGQRARTEQDTVEVRANTTAACLSAPGAIGCRREARFTLEQDDAGFSVVGESAPGAHRLVYGLDASRGEVSEVRDGRQTRLDTGESTHIVGTDIFPTSDFPRSRFERLGVFAQDELRALGVTWIPALRYDRFETRPLPDDRFTAANPGRTPVSTSDAAWSPKLGARVPFGAGLEATLQAATGFRAPPFFDVNVGLSNLPLGYTVIPNADLRPEKSRGLEAGLRGRHAGLRWTLVAHRTDYRDLIVSRAPLACPGDPRCVPTAPITFQSQNVTRARIEGLEAKVEAQLGGGWHAKLGAAGARGDDRSRGAPLNSVDPAKAVATFGYEGAFAAARKAGFDLHVTHAARKTRIDPAPGTLFATPAYTIADLTMFAELGRHVAVTAGLFNLGDRKYWLWSDVRGIVNPGVSIDRYTQPGRSAAVSVRVAF